MTSPRRLAALVFNLPPESAMKRAAQERGEWTHERELAALGVEALHGVARQLDLLRHQHANKKAGRWTPWRYDHPDRPGGKPKKVTAREGLGQLMKRLGG